MNEEKIEELNEESLEQVSGGSNRTKNIYTLMNCMHCGYNSYLNGLHVGEIQKCPKCGNNTLEGTALGYVKDGIFIVGGNNMAYRT